MPTEYRYGGQLLEEHLNIYRMGARWVDPSLNRWLQPDSIIPDPANPQSFNRYSYCLGNPLRFIDPTGHFAEEELIAWGAYTAEELKWLAEQQVDWYNYLMQAAVGDAFWFVGQGAIGIGQFQLDDNKRLRISGAFWTETMGTRLDGNFQEWAKGVGKSRIHDEGLVPEDKLIDQLPNPHIQLSDQAAELNAGIVLGIDIAAGIVTYAGYGIILADTIAAPCEPVGKLFGYAITRVGSGISALAVMDSILTCGPNSWGTGVSIATWVGGWVGPVAPITPAVQIYYDIYTLRRLEMRHKR